MHRDQEGCAKCHAGIDPWGLPFEHFGADGLLSPEKKEAHSVLPDGTTIDGVRTLKDYLLAHKLDRIAFSVMKHLMTYAIGRDLTYNEVESLKETGLELRSDGYRMQDMIRFVVQSEPCLEK